MPDVPPAMEDRAQQDGELEQSAVPVRSGRSSVADKWRLPTVLSRRSSGLCCGSSFPFITEVTAEAVPSDTLHVTGRHVPFLPLSGRCYGCFLPGVTSAGRWIGCRRLSFSSRFAMSASRVSSSRFLLFPGFRLMCSSTCPVVR